MIRVYEAERAAFPNFADGPTASLRTTAQIELFVQQTLSACGYKDRHPVVRPGKGARWARGGLHTVTFPLWARTVPVVLHELSHHISAREGLGRRGHGSAFSGIYVALVHKRMGYPSARRLAEEMERLGIKIGDGWHF